MFDINFFVPKGVFKDRLNDIINNKCLTLERTGEKTPTVRVKVSGLNDPEFEKRLMKLDRFGVGYLIALTNAIKDGPKLITPSFEQCLALEQIEIRIPYSEYEQPYPSVLVEFPYKYYESIKERGKLKIAPKGAVCYHNSELEVIIITLLFHVPGYSDITTYMNSNPKIETIEDEFQILNPTDVEAEMSVILKQIYRLLMNLNLLLVSEGHKQLGYVNPKIAKKEKDPRRRLIHVGFEQNIKLYNRAKMESGNNGGEHASPKPHWRRGFYRRQHYGPGNSLVKRVFIKPVFVCADDFTGDLGDTTVRYSL